MARAGMALHTAAVVFGLAAAVAAEHRPGRQATDVSSALDADSECSGTGHETCSLNMAQRQSEVAAVAAALETDSECEVGDESCALSMAQLRAKASTAASASADPVQEMVSTDRWPWSSSSSSSTSAGAKYHAKCYGNAGSPGCASAGSSGSKSGGTCVCDKGCMGADGNCYDQENKVVGGTKFTISNKKWPDHKMYVQRLSVLGQMKTTSFSSTYNFGQDQFQLYELPGDFEGRKEYFLGSAKWPDYVVSIQATKGTAFSLFGAYAISLAKEHSPWGLRDVMLRICSARKMGHPDAVMIGTSVPSGGSTIWAYIHEGSYFVYGYWYPERLIESKIVPSSVSSKLPGGTSAESPVSIESTPGEGGFWVPDPPFPDDFVLPDC